MNQGPQKQVLINNLQQGKFDDQDLPNKNYFKTSWIQASKINYITSIEKGVYDDGRPVAMLQPERDEMQLQISRNFDSKPSERDPLSQHSPVKRRNPSMQMESYVQEADVSHADGLKPKNSTQLLYHTSSFS